MLVNYIDAKDLAIHGTNKMRARQKLRYIEASDFWNAFKLLNL